MVKEQPEPNTIGKSQVLARDTREDLLRGDSAPSIE